MLSGIVSYITTPSVEQDLAKLKTVLSQFEKGTLDINNDLLNDLVKTMKAHAKDRKMSLLGCHIISNIALDEQHAVTMIEHSAAKVICKVLKAFRNDSRVVWKASSALWNLCRPINIGDHIPKHCAELVFACLIDNQDSTRATHTSLGALSNLALVCPEAFKKCMTRVNLMCLRNVIQKYSHVSEICGHFGALVANMSVSTDLAAACVALDFVQVLIQCLSSGSLKTTESVKHVVAALHNLSDVRDFNARLCFARGIETLRLVQSLHGAEVSDFVDGIFDLGDMPIHASHSLHVASVCCDLPVVVKLMQETPELLDVPDREGLTACDLAIQNQGGEVVEALMAAGAMFSRATYDAMEDDARRLMKPFIRRGLRHRKRSQQVMRGLLNEHSSLFNDMAHVVTEYIPGVDLLLVLDSN